VFNWIDLSLQKFIEKTSAEKIKDTEFMFMNYNKFKEEIWRAFNVIDEKCVTEQKIHTLWQNESAAKYTAEFQWVAVLTEWDDNALTSQFY